jgi:hypothetical protein
VPVNLAPGTYTVTMQDLNPNSFTNVPFASKGSTTDNSKALNLNTVTFTDIKYNKIDNTMLLADWHTNGEQWRAGGYLDANNSYKYTEVNQKIAINTIATTSTDSYVTLQDAVTWAIGDTITIYDSKGIQIGTAKAGNSTPAPGEHPNTWVPVNPDPAPLSNSYNGLTGELTAASIISAPLTLIVGGGSSSIIFENYTGPGLIIDSISATVYEI